MSEGILQSFNINELAGATGLILGGLSGLLVVIFKSRCYCKFRIGFSDDCSICMCSRSPPPDTNEDTDGEDEKKNEKAKGLQNKVIKKEDKILKEVETPKLIPKTKSKDERILPYPDDEIDKLV